MLKIEHLNKSFGSTQVLFGVNFDVPDRRILGLVGKMDRVSRRSFIVF